MRADDRFLVVAVVQAAVLGGLAGTAATMTLAVPIDTAYSGPAAIAATWLVRLLLVAAGATIPLALALPAREPAHTAGVTRPWWRTAAIALLVLVLAAAVIVLVVFAVLVQYEATALLGLGIAIGVVLAAGLLAHRRRRPVAPTALPVTRGRVLGLVAVFLVSFVFIPGVVVSPTDHIERYGVDIPESEFTVEYEAVDDDWGVVTVTHVGGDPVEPDRLTIAARPVNESYPDDVVVDQVASEQWAGQASGRSADGEPRVVEGDSVRVAVHADCRLRVGYRGSRHTTLGAFDCPAADRPTPSTPQG